MEAIRTYRANPYLVIGTHHIPTWTTPLLLTFVVAALVPSTSLLGHLCGLVVGYISRKLRLADRIIMSLTSVQFSRPRLCQIYCSSRVGAPMARVETQSARHLAALRQCRPEDIW